MAKNVSATSLFSNMQKVETSDNVITKPVDKVEEPASVMDESTKEAPAKVYRPTRNIIRNDNIFEKNEKEIRSVHKNFLISKGNAAKLSNVAKTYRISENEVINRLLDNYL